VLRRTHSRRASLAQSQRTADFGDRTFPPCADGEADAPATKPAAAHSGGIDRKANCRSRPVFAYPPSEPDRTVVPFRNGLRRHAAQPATPSDPAQGPVRDLSGYERTTQDGPEEYRHRMAMNGLGALVLIALMAAGWWIADSMANLRKNQDCALSGRKNCEKIEVPPQPGTPQLPKE
jgi:hypothetical protein